jgi:hypothetical protein
MENKKVMDQNMILFTLIKISIKIGNLEKIIVIIKIIY